jgi:hypothetical protein
MRDPVGSVLTAIGGMDSFLFVFLATIVGLSILVPMTLAIARAFGLYTIVHERRCHVYVLFGKVVGIIDEPGLHILPPSSSTGSATATSSTCGSTRNTCAASP